MDRAHRYRPPQPAKSPVQGHRYILLNKPYDVLSQFTDASGRKTLSAFVPVHQVYPVGRLDRDSEGLLLLTSDGGLQHRLSHPKFHHPKTYWAQVERIPDEMALERLRRGVEIQGYRTRPATVRLISPSSVPPRDPPIRYRKSVPTAWLELTITEGRNRQVRRMTAAVGFPTLRLIRVAIASLTLGALAPGTRRDLTPREIDQLRRLGKA
ncbi:MAG: pseudouridine synthase [Elainellaceae cyanobacterium]